MSNLTITNEDNMVLMARYPDKYFDLAIVDPPYGLDFGSFNRTNKSSSGTRYKANKYHNGDWDKSIPTEEYFSELRRVSKNQIVWGGNYFPLTPTQCVVFWYKHQPVANFADGEMAWTSFKKPALCFDFPYYGGIQGKTKADVKIHPTQKPVALYKWLLDKFAKPGDKILDTHLGSGSIAIACHDMGFDLTACELDKDYYEAAMKRIKKHISQLSMFDTEPEEKKQIVTQTEMFK
jgi:site-specific DNA-methyltransferase (adenine-specific)